jgi:hypothetical protein
MSTFILLCPERAHVERYVNTRLLFPYPPVFHPVGVVPVESSTPEFVMILVGVTGGIAETIVTVKLAVVSLPLVSLTEYGIVVVPLKFETGVNTTSPVVVLAVQVPSGFIFMF